MLARIEACVRWKTAPRRRRPGRKPLFDKRGQLLPRERVALLLDAGAPWLPLSRWRAGCRTRRPERSGARRRRDRRHRLDQRRALHGGGQ
jgi:acetyl-CoA carboxylase carboxyltransferase component